MAEEARRDAGSAELRQSQERFRLLVESVREYAIVMLDPSGNVVTWNGGAERITGYPASAIVGQDFSRFYPPEALASGLPQRALDVAASTGAIEEEGWRVRQDGSLFWANVVLTAMRAHDGQLIGFAQVARDLTLRRQHEEALRQGEERFRLLVEGVREYAIFMLDVNGKVASWNVGAQRLKGYTADEVIGQHFSIFYPADARDSGWPEHELQVAADKGSFVDEGWRVRKDGTLFWANVTITALRDDGGRLIGFAKLTRDLTDDKRAKAAELASRHRDEILEAERSARMAAQRATRIKDEFLATLSHELRTPLSAILGWTQILLKSPGVNPDILQKAIQVIDRNARAQVQLIDDLLDLSRIMTGKIRLDLRQVSMLDVVQAAIDGMAPTAAAKEIRLSVVMDPTPALVNADSGRLQQVVWNLLSNAIKFTPKGGQIQVLLQRVNSHIELSVSDTGIGIPAEFLPHVFERFSQGDASSTTRSYGGLGLGLAICKQLVELHGGTIRAASQGEGQGATFFVDLPLSIVQLKPHEGGRTHPTTEAVGADAIELPRLGGVHVFVVDDEPDVRDLLQRILVGQGARVTIFTAAEQALSALEMTRPTVIVSDVGMPQMDGYQFMRAWRVTEARGERIPALALTAFARSEDRKRSLMAGYQAHLSKPFDVAELILVVADLVGR